jgi:hypothetical protein
MILQYVWKTWVRPKFQKIISTICLTKNRHRSQIRNHLGPVVKILSLQLSPPLPSQL